MSDDQPLTLYASPNYQTKSGLDQSDIDQSSGELNGGLQAPKEFRQSSNELSDFDGRTHVQYDARSAGTIQRVDGDLDGIIHVNNSGGTIVLDVSNISYFRLFHFIAGPNSPLVLDGGPATKFLGYGPGGAGLRVEPSEAATIVRLSRHLINVLSERNSPVFKAIRTSQEWMKEAGGRYRLSGSAALKKNVDTTIVLPTKFAGSENFRVVFSVGYEPQPEFISSINPVYELRSMRTRGETGISGPSFTLRNPNFSPLTIDYVVHGLTA